MSKKKLSRRSFLRAAAGAGAAAAAAPWVFIPRKAFAAATAGHGAAEHVLILYAGGGLRSQPLFFGDAAFKHNPFGLPTTPLAAGAQWTPGKVVGDQPIPLFSFGTTTQVDPLPAIANDIAILQGVDQQPMGGNPIIDHGTGDIMLTQGYANADRGLLSIIHRDYAGYLNGTTVLPPFDLGLSTFARGVNEFAAYRPISLQSANDFTGKSAGFGDAERAPWAKKMRRDRDAAFINKRAPHVRPYLTAAMDAKVNSKAYASALHNPGLDLLGAPDAQLGGISNSQMLEVLGSTQQGSQWGMEVAFALRSFQLGVPAASILRFLYDDHSDEKTLLPVDAADLGRQLAGINFLLKRLHDQNGQLLWDKTVVLVMSEFGRDDYGDTGFNSAQGSDHQGTAPSRNQVWPVMGGPISAKGKVLGGLDPATLATVNGPAFSVRSVHSTILDVLGIDSSIHYPDDPPIAGLFT